MSALMTLTKEHGPMEYEQLGGSLHSHFIEVACMTQDSQPPDFAFHSSEEYPRLHHAVPLLPRP